MSQGFRQALFRLKAQRDLIEGVANDKDVINSDADHQNWHGLMYFIRRVPGKESDATSAVDRERDCNHACDSCHDPAVQWTATAQEKEQVDNHDNKGNDSELCIVLLLHVKDAVIQAKTGHVDFNVLIFAI